MTREDAKELLPIIQAFAAGKQIQDAIEGLTDWVDTDEINLEYEGQKIKHRIKPEQKYRPFKTKEECWNEMMKHQPFGWLKDTDTGGYIIISELYDEDIEISGNNGWDYVGLMTCYTFSDGTPFGVKEKQYGISEYS